MPATKQQRRDIRETVRGNRKIDAWSGRPLVGPSREVVAKVFWAEKLRRDNKVSGRSALRTVSKLARPSQGMRKHIRNQKAIVRRGKR
jgi:hypothetical protein